MATITERLVAVIQAKPDHFVRGMKKVLSITGKVMSKMKSWKTLLGAGILIGMVKMAADLEKNLAEVHTLLEVENRAFAKYSKQVLDYSDAIGKSSKELTAGLYQAISAGVDWGNSLGFIEQASTLAIAGATDLLTAVDILTGVLNAYGLGAEKAAWASDVLFNTIVEGKVRMNELGYHLGKVLSIASQVGVGLESLTSAVAALTKQQVPLRIGITGLVSLFTELLKPQDEALAAAERLGVDWSLASIQARDLGGFLYHLKERIGGNVQEMAKLSSSNQTLRALTVLLGDGFEDYMAILDRSTNSQGKSTRAAQKMNDTLSRQWETMMAKIKNLSINIGQMFLPALKEITKDIGNVAKSLRRWLVDEGIIEKAGNVMKIGWGKIRNFIKDTSADIIGYLHDILEAAKELIEGGFLTGIWGTAGGLFAKAAHEGDALWNMTQDWSVLMKNYTAKLVALNEQYKAGSISTADYQASVKELQGVYRPMIAEAREWELKNEEIWDGIDEGWRKVFGADQRETKLTRALRKLEKLERGIRKERTKERNNELNRELFHEEQYYSTRKGLGDDYARTEESLRKQAVKGEYSFFKTKEYLEADARHAREMAERKSLRDTTKYVEEELTKQTDLYIDEINTRMNYAETLSAKIERLESERTRSSEGFEEKMFKLKIQHLTKQGQMLQTGHMAEMFFGRARRQEAEGNFEEAERLALKAQEHWERIATETLGPQRDEAIRKMIESQQLIARNQDAEKQAAVETARANEQKIEQLKAKLADLHKKAMEGVEVLVKTDKSEKKIQELIEQLNKLRDRVIQIDVRARLRAIEQHATGGTVGSGIPAMPAGPLSHGRDTVLCGLEPGEEVTSRGPASRSRKLLRAINRGAINDSTLASGSLPRFESGGTVPMRSGGAGVTLQMYFEEKITKSTMRNVVIPAIARSHARGWAN